jgi:hypothetical protein
MEFAIAFLNAASASKSHRPVQGLGNSVLPISPLIYFHLAKFKKLKNTYVTYTAFLYSASCVIKDHITLTFLFASATHALFFPRRLTISFIH